MVTDSCVFGHLKAHSMSLSCTRRVLHWVFGRTSFHKRPNTQPELDSNLVHVLVAIRTMHQTHNTGHHFVRFRHIHWKSRNSSDTHIQHPVSYITPNSSGKVNPNTSIPIAPKSQQQADKGISRQFSTPVSPTTIMHPSVYLDYEPPTFNFNASAPTSRSPGLQPFHVFRMAPPTLNHPTNRSPPPALTPAPEWIIDGHQRLFRVTEDLCIRAAQMYLRRQRSGPSIEPTATLCPASRQDQRHHPYNGGRASRGQQLSNGVEQNASLMEYILQIVDIQLERAGCVTEEYEAAVAGSLTTHDKAHHLGGTSSKPCEGRWT